MSEDVQEPSMEGIERRRFLRGAATVAWAAPLILTMPARTAGAQALSCIPNGTVCDACAGMNCCDQDPSSPEGGCCCSDANSPECGGVCVPVDANCATLNTTGTDFTCYSPANSPTAGFARTASTAKGAKS